MVTLPFVDLGMYMIKDYKCAKCGLIFKRHLKQVNQVIKRVGIWRCKPCANKEKNLSFAKEIGYIRKHSQSGYLEIKTSNGFMRFHRYVIEQSLGRKLLKNEDVHHIDEDIYNNSIDNLLLLTHAEHTSLHNTGKKHSKLTISRMAKAKEILSNKDVISIRNLFSNGNSQRSIALKFNVSPSIIYRIVRNLTYKDI